MLMLRNKERGFTIIELLIAIGIFGVVVPALATGINNLVVLNNRTRDLALANLIVESKAEQIRSAGYNSLTPGSIDFSDELPAELAPPKSAAYSVTSPAAGVAEVMITINYNDYGSTRTQSYKTVVSELGVGQ